MTPTNTLNNHKKPTACQISCHISGHTSSETRGQNSGLTSYRTSCHTACFIASAMLLSPLSAASILYDLRDTSQASAIESGSYTVDGVLLSLSTTDGSLNQTSGGFGINHSGSGDITDELDGAAGAETIAFSFSVSGTLDLIEMSAYGPGDSYELRKNGNLVLSLTDQGASSPDSFFPAESFLASDEFTLTFTGGNGSSLDTLSITAVPEPASSLLLACSLTGFLFFNRKRRE